MMEQNSPENLKLAESLGYAVERKPENGIHIISGFNRGPVRVWQIRDGWQVADLIDGYMCNHRPCETLKAALLKGCI